MCRITECCLNRLEIRFVENYERFKSDITFDDDREKLAELMRGGK